MFLFMLLIKIIYIQQAVGMSWTVAGFHETLYAFNLCKNLILLGFAHVRFWNLQFPFSFDRSEDGDTEIFFNVYNSTSLFKMSFPVGWNTIISAVRNKQVSDDNLTRLWKC
jgi:hypothetical protein